MTNSILMDIIVSIIIVFGYYLYTKFDKNSEELNMRNILALFIICMIVLNVIKLLFSKQSTITKSDSSSIPFHDKPPF